MDFPLPELGEGVYEAELVAWLVKVGDRVQRGQNLMEVLTDKATMEVPAPFIGTITSLGAEAGKPIKVGEVILTYSAEATGPKTNRMAATVEKTREKGDGQRPGKPGRRVDLPTAPGTFGTSALPAKAAPSVRYLARKLGIDLSKVSGSGPEGRILLDDLPAQLQRSNGPVAVPAPAEPPPDYGTPGTRKKLQGLRRKVAERMVHSKQTIPHYGYVDECDVTDLVRLRASLRETLAQNGVKLTYLAFVVKAVAAALHEVALVNASLDEEAGEIVFHDTYHVGFAVATPAGLIVPVIHQADRKELAQVAQEIERLSAAARAGKVRLEELRGGTFTVTSIGSIGGLFSTPVINSPEVGILGIGKVVKRPVFDAAGNVRPADMMYLSFAFDHRVVDGAVGAAFGNAVLRYLHNPALLLLPNKILPKGE